MTIKIVEEVGIIRTEVRHCDGPWHRGSRIMEGGDAICVDHGYGSPMDGDRHHFCSLKCLERWILKVNHPRKSIKKTMKTSR